jgi:uncharacterized protein
VTEAKLNLMSLPAELWDPELDATAFRVFEFHRGRALYHIGSNSVFSANSDFYKLYAFMSGLSSELSLSDTALLDVVRQWKAVKSFKRPHIDDVTTKISQIAISPTLNCNLSCNYCYNFQELPEAKIRKLPSLEDSGIKKILETISQLPVDDKINIAFIGGEPLLNPDKLERLIRIARRAARSRNIKVNFLVTTNGLTLGRPQVIKLVNKYNISVSVSLDGPPEWHNETRHLLNGQNSYEKISNSLKLFMRDYHSPYRSVRATHKLIPGRILGTYRHMKELGFNDIAMGSSEFDNRLVSDEDKQRLYAEIDCLSHELESDMISGVVARHSWFTEIFINLFLGNVKQIICGATRNHVAFDVYGGMQACHRYLGNDQYELEVTDITQRFGSELVAQITKFGKTPHCATCWARSLCGGECFHVGKEMDKKTDSAALQQQICDYKRKKFEQGIRAYFSIMESRPERMPELVYGVSKDLFDPNKILANLNAD